MSNRYWLLTTAFIGLAILGAIAWWLVERHDERERAYQATHNQYEYSKGDQIPGARIRGKRSVPDPKSYREEWRNERDLEAQRDMADWAFYMLIATCGSVIVTSIGVIYVARTLSATREAVRETAAANNASNIMAGIAEKQFIASHRPRIRVRFIQNVTLGEQEPFEVWVTFANIGESNGMITAFGGDIGTKRGFHWEPPGLAATPRALDRPPTVASGERESFNIVGSLSSGDILDINHDRITLYAVGEIEYTDTIGVVRRTSFFRVYNPAQSRFTKCTPNDADAQELEYED
jgi:hypothetical protein